MKLGNDDHSAALAGALGLCALNLMLRFHKYLKTNSHDHQLLHHHHESLIPRIEFSYGGFIRSVEVFGDYVVRQIGVAQSSRVGKQLAEVAEGYLRGDKTRSDLSLQGLFVFLSEACPQMRDEEMARLNEEVVKELDACMVAYFSFHWHHSAALLDQVQSGESKLRQVVMSATRKQRFQRVTNTLKMQRTFSTLVDQLKVMRRSKRATDVPDDKTVVVPAEHHNRSPVLLMIGGGMGAGKSTVVREIMSSPFWSGVAQDAVVVEADAFKETDVIYRTLSSLHRGVDVAEASQLVHQSSTNAASSLLVAALNEGRDVIFDGTLSWEPFVLQTLAMARDVHRRRYRMGPGYKVTLTESGSSVIEERYWEPVAEDEQEEEEEEEMQDRSASASPSPSNLSANDLITSSNSPSLVDLSHAVMQKLQAGRKAVPPTSSSGHRPPALSKQQTNKVASTNSSTIKGSSFRSGSYSQRSVRERKPYRIELVGVTCDAQLAVVRGIRRAILTKRAVPIKGQLRSHKLFAQSLEKYCELVDQVKIYSTNHVGGQADLIGWKDGQSCKLLVDCESFKAVRDLCHLNCNAGSVVEMYEDDDDDDDDDDGRCKRGWHHLLISSQRASRQELLRKELASQNLERSLTPTSISTSSSSSTFFSASDADADEQTS